MLHLREKYELLLSNIEYFRKREDEASKMNHQPNMTKMTITELGTNNNKVLKTSNHSKVITSDHFHNSFNNSIKKEESLRQSKNSTFLRQSRESEVLHQSKGMSRLQESQREVNHSK